MPRLLYSVLSSFFLFLQSPKATAAARIPAEVLISMNYSAIHHQIAPNQLVFHDALDTFASTNFIDSTKQLHGVTRLYGVQPVSGCCGRIEGFKKYPAVAAAGR
jgi:hypothetical protein